VLQYCKDNAIESHEQVFREITVVVSVEPCIMCMSALYNLKVCAIIFGCKNDRFGGQTVVDVAQYIENETSVKGGVCEGESMVLLKKFYKMENPAAPIPAKREKRSLEI
jgi:tRNA-specific adenosine deaminase 2